MDTNISTNTPTTPQPSSFEIESLFKAAFSRTKSRFFSYFITVIISFGIMLGIIIASVLIGALLVGLLTTLKNPILMGLVLVIGGLGAYVGFSYISVWMQLAMTKVIMQPNLGAMEAIKSTKSIAWGFFIYSMIFGLFLLGLLPFGILSIGIIFILWAMWASFSAFVYLDYQKKGLQNLWVSRAIVNQSFWGVLLRLIILYVTIYAVIIILSVVGGDNGFVTALIIIISLLIGPFIVSYMYELYLSLKARLPAGFEMNVKPSKVWLAFSIIGGILLTLGIVAFGSVLASQLPDIMQEIQNTQPQKNFPIPSIPAERI